MIVYCDGDWRCAAEAAIPTADRGFTLGDGLFETMLWRDGAVARLRRHAGRLAESAALLALPPPPDAAMIAALADEIVRRNGLSGRAAIRLTWTAGDGARGLARPDQPAPRLVVTAGPHARPAAAATLLTSSIRRNETAPTSRVKSLSYLDQAMARAEAVARGADEALQFNTAGRLACAAAGNVFLEIEGRIVTPPVSEGALPGTMRAALIDAVAGIEVRPVEAAELAAATAIAATNALNGVWRAASCDGRRLAEDGLAPLVAAAEAD